MGWTRSLAESRGRLRVHYELLIDSKRKFEVAELELDNEGEEPDGFKCIDGEEEVDVEEDLEVEPSGSVRNPMMICRMGFWSNNYCNDTNCQFPLNPPNPHI